MAGGESVKKLSEGLLHTRGVDVLVGTPARVQEHIANGSLNLKHLTSVVIDEIDTMSDEFYERDVLKLLARLSKSKPPQV